MDYYFDFTECNLTHYQINYFSVEVTFSLTISPSSVGFSAIKLRTSAFTAILYMFMTHTLTTAQYFWIVGLSQEGVDFFG